MCQLTKPSMRSSRSAAMWAIQSIQNARWVPSIAGPPNLALLLAQMRLQQIEDAGCHRLVDAAVLRIADIAADVGIVRLVPHAPIPILHLLATPLLQAAPDDVAAARGEIANVGRLVERRMELGEGDHRLGAGVEHGLQHGGEPMPFLDRIGHRLVEREHADHLGAHQLQAAADLLAMIAERERGPAVDLVEAVAQPHRLCRG